MPPHLSILFRARPPLEFAKPIPKGKCKPLVSLLDNTRDYMSMFEQQAPPKPDPPERAHERKQRLTKEKMIKHLIQQKEETKEFAPHKDPNIKGDPYKTIIVSRLSYKTDEKKLRREFETFGPIRRMRLIVDKNTGKSRGYAFIEYEHERDLEDACRRGDGRRIDGKRVVVDMERGRTKRDWLPRRLGQGKGDSRRDRNVEKQVRELKRTHPSLRSKSRSRERERRRERKSSNTEKKEENQTTNKEE